MSALTKEGERTLFLDVRSALPNLEERLSLRQQVRAFSRGGDVVRFHTRPQLQPQGVGAHTYGVMWLLWVMTGGAVTAHLLYAAMVHDTPEFVVGDLPAPLKRKVAGPLLDKLEADVMHEARLPVPALDEEEGRLLKLADNLEGLRHCVRERQLGNQLIKACYERYKLQSAELCRTPRENYLWSFFNQCWEEATNGT